MINFVKWLIKIQMHFSHLLVIKLGYQLDLTYLVIFFAFVQQ
jgi:hypothetical protein